MSLWSMSPQDRYSRTRSPICCSLTSCTGAGRFSLRSAGSSSLGSDSAPGRLSWARSCTCCATTIQGNPMACSASTVERSWEAGHIACTPLHMFAQKPTHTSVKSCGLVVFRIDLSQSVTCDSNCCWSCRNKLTTFHKNTTLILQHATYIFVINNGCE